MIYQKPCSRRYIFCPKINEESNNQQMQAVNHLPSAEPTAYSQGVGDAY